MPDVTFVGEKFRTNTTIPVMALMRLARVTKVGVSGENLAPVIAALDEVVEQLIDPADWDRFQATAMTSRAGVDDLMAFIREARDAMGKQQEPAAPEPEPVDAKTAPVELWGETA
jgi:hypothetical protein